MEKPLRKCKDCGLEAYTESDLEQFIKVKNAPHGRITWCKKCKNIYDRKNRELYPLRYRYRYMMTRCYNPNNDWFHIYGGRGITVCEEWGNNRQSFYDWSKENGFKPELSLDRINTEGPYSPENCRWATPQQQGRNTRYNVTNFEKGTRICSKCKVEKPLKEFHKNKSRRMGYCFLCKKCDSERGKEYYRRLKKRKSACSLWLQVLASR